jgi:GH25 family lysozyme M1 (1,4-beta-N-acetylmuramidase)
MIQGIDVSDCQGLIDYKKIKDNNDIKFIFCKATDGESYVQKKFKRNSKGILESGKLRGFYHFSHTKNDPVKEATHFCTVVMNENLTNTDMLVLDMEDDKNILSPEKFLDWNLKFLITVELLSNITPIIYTGGPYFDKHSNKLQNDTASKLEKYPLWLAAYTRTPNKYLPYIWKDKGYTLWQCSGDAAAKGEQPLRIPGIATVVDKNLYNGSLEDLEALAHSLHRQSIKLDYVPMMPVDLNTPIKEITTDNILPIPTLWGKIKNIFK